MKGVLLSVLFAGIAGVSLAPSAADEVQRCLDTCDRTSSKTDRATCRLTCREATRAKDEPDVVKWRKTQLLGGSPDPKVKGGTTTTIETRSPRDTKKTTAVTHGPSSSATPRGVPRRTEQMSSCQLGCVSEFSATDRATCHLQCIARFGGVVTASSSSAPPPARRIVPAGARERCRSRCRAEATPSDRATCRQQCFADATRQKPRAKAKATPAPPRAKTPASSSDCRNRCAGKVNRCRDACTGHGSNRNTCDLQCDQLATSCARRCDR